MRTIVLGNANKSIVARLAGAVSSNQPHFVTSFADSSPTSFTENSVDGELNGTSEVLIIGAPTIPNVRIVKDINIFNADDAPIVLIVEYANSSDRRVLSEVTLQVGETWTLAGTYTVTGAIKVEREYLT